MKLAVAMLGALLVSAFPGSVMALTVDADGWVSCGAGKIQVFWEEDVGMDERYRRIIVGNYPEPRLWLVRSPSDDHSAKLEDMTGGTNIPWRGLQYSNGEAFGGYRYVLVSTAGDGSPSGRSYGGKPVYVLMVGLSMYWPVCAFTATVGDWLAAAQDGPPPQD